MPEPTPTLVRREGAAETSAPTTRPGVSVPSFELDLFGRVRSLSHAAAAAIFRDRSSGARRHGWRWSRDCRRVAPLWCRLQPAGDRQRNRQERGDVGEAHPRAAGRRGRAAHRSSAGGADPDRRRGRCRPADDCGGAGRERAAVAGRSADRSGPAAQSIDEAAPTVAELPAGLSSTILLRRPDVLQAEYRASRRQCRDRRRARCPVPADQPDRACSAWPAARSLKLFTGGAFGWSAGADASYTDLPGRRRPRQRPPQRSPAQRRRRRLSEGDPDGLPRSRGCAGQARDDGRRAEGPDRSKRSRCRCPQAERSALSRRHRELSRDARRAALILFGPAGAGPRRSWNRRKTWSASTRRSAATSCSGLRPLERPVSPL